MILSKEAIIEEIEKLDIEQVRQFLFNHNWYEVFTCDTWRKKDKMYGGDMDLEDTESAYLKEKYNFKLFDQKEKEIEWALKIQLHRSINDNFLFLSIPFKHKDFFKTKYPIKWNAKEKQWVLPSLYFCKKEFQDDCLKHQTLVNWGIRI